MTDWNLKLQAFLYPDRYSFISGLDKFIKDLHDSLSLDSSSQVVVEADKISIAMSGSITKENKIQKLKHPFSCEVSDILLHINEEKCNALKRELKNNDSPQKTFLTLWRHLPTVLELAPDGTFFSNPCFWDIRNMSSAIASTGPSRAYLSFTVAGIHDFISPSRRTQDLWVGSYLISYLMWKAMEPVVDELGPDVIIQPNLIEQPLVDIWLNNKQIPVNIPKINDLKIANFPNFYFCLVPENDAKRLAKESTDSLLRTWNAICSKVKIWIEKKVNNKVFDNCWNNIWERQNKDVFEIYWAYGNWGEKPEDILEDYKSITANSSENDELYKIFEDFTCPDNLNCPEKWGFVYPFLSKLTGEAVVQRKNLRKFNLHEEPGEKCTLCGTREALHTKYNNENRWWIELKEFWEDLKDSLDIRLRKGEKLCSVCLIKRVAAEAYFKKTFEMYYPKQKFNANFPSTGSISSADFKLKLFENLESNTGLQNLITLYIAAINKLDIQADAPILPKFDNPKFNFFNYKNFASIDGEWLYEEALTSEKIIHLNEEKYQNKIDEGDLISALDSLKNLKAEAKKLNINFPSKYYALLYMDGDKMSRWVNGKNLPKLNETFSEDTENRNSNKKRTLSPSLHRSLSTALRNYALRIVREVIEERHTGKLIYAGGDDVMAFVPIEDLFNSLQELRILFSGGECKKEGLESRNGFVKIGDSNDWSMVMGNCASASIGVVISHYLHPLYRTVGEVNDALFTTAKEDLNRDSFAISVIKKSGQILRTGAKWQYEGNDGTNIDTIEVLMSIIDCFKEDELSTSLPYYLREGGIGIDRFNIEDQASEFKRILRRHYRDTNSEKYIKLEDNLVQLLYMKIKKSDSCCIQENNEIKNINTNGWETIIDLLLVARFIAGGGLE